MEKAEYYKMEELEKTYWWHKGKVYLVERLVKNLFGNRKDLTVLEIGCGAGNITKMLENYGNVTGIDVSHEAIEASRNKGLKNVVEADINQMDLKGYIGKFDLVCALDVLEHIQDDVETIKRVKSVLKEGGYFLVNVPAHKFLWSEHDEALHHKRRYSMTEISSKLTDCGFKIKKKSYFVSAFFFPIMVFRLLTNIITTSTYPKTSYVILPGPINDFMTKILHLEARIVEKVYLPFGVTIVTVAEK